MTLNRIAKKWVAALRSGKYKQGRRALHTKRGHCCLGVLECVALEEKVINTLSYRGQGALTQIVREWAGLKSMLGAYVDSNGKRSDLAAQNDRNKKSFAQIADIIESKPKGLFR